jgi:hypothetical protein
MPVNAFSSPEERIRATRAQQEALEAAARSTEAARRHPDAPTTSQEPVEAEPMSDSAETPASADPSVATIPLFDPPVRDPADLEPAGEPTAAAQPVAAEPRSRGGNGDRDRSQHIPEFLRHAMQSAGPGGAWSYRTIGEREFWVNDDGDSTILCDRRRRRALVIDGAMSHSKLFGPAGLLQSTYRYPRPAKRSAS